MLDCTLRASFSLACSAAFFRFLNSLRTNQQASQRLLRAIQDQSSLTPRRWALCRDLNFHCDHIWEDTRTSVKRTSPFAQLVAALIKKSVVVLLRQIHVLASQPGKSREKLLRKLTSILDVGSAAPIPRNLKCSCGGGDFLGARNAQCLRNLMRLHPSELTRSTGHAASGSAAVASEGFKILGSFTKADRIARYKQGRTAPDVRR